MTVGESAAESEAAAGAVRELPPAAAPWRVLREIAAALSRDDLAQEIADLASRLGEGRFFVAVLGQFKRGKSSLVNALVGRTILPVGMRLAPSTSAPRRTSPPPKPHWPRSAARPPRPS